MAKVLVIDDDPRIRRLVKRILTGARHQVIEAIDGSDGLKKLESEARDIVITDIVMPEMEGIQTMREIRGSGSKAAIVAMSGGGTNIGKNYLDMAAHLGADAILAKPFRPEELLAILHDLTKSEPGPSSA